MVVDARQKVARKLSAYGQRKREHERRERKLRNDLARLTMEARDCRMSQDEIAKLTGTSQPVISRILRASE